MVQSTGSEQLASACEMQLPVPTDVHDMQSLPCPSRSFSKRMGSVSFPAGQGGAQWAVKPSL